MENDVHAQLYRWFQARAGAPAGQRARAAVGSLSVAQQDRLHAELQGILVAAAGGTTQPDAGAVAVMSRAVLQYIEALVTLALDHAAAAGGMDASEKHVVAVLAPHNEYQAVRSAALVRKYHRIRAMTSHEAVRVPVEGYHEGIRSASQLSVGPLRTALLEKEAFEARALAYVPPPLLPPPGGAFSAAAVGAGGGGAAAPQLVAPPVPAAGRPHSDAHALAAAGAAAKRGAAHGITMHAAGVAGVASQAGAPGGGVAQAWKPAA